MKPPLDLRLYAITDPRSPHGVEAAALAAAKGGATLVQLRDKTLSDADLTALATRLVAALAPLAVPLLVNDRVAVAAAAGAAGVHLGQGDGDVAAARARLGQGALIGLSVENGTQLAEAPLADVDYLGVGPVHPTLTKPDHAPPIGYHGLAALAAASPVPVVAIGGLSLIDARAVKAAGAAGMALVSALMMADAPGQAAAELRRAWDEA